MSGVFSITIPGTAPLASFAPLPVRLHHFPVRGIALAIVVLSLFHAAPATAQHRFNVPNGGRGMENAKQAAQIRLLEKWNGLLKSVFYVTDQNQLKIGGAAYAWANNEALPSNTNLLIEMPVVRIHRFKDEMPSASSYGAYVLAGSARGTKAAPQPLLAGQDLAAFEMEGYTQKGYTSSGGSSLGFSGATVSIRGVAAENFSATSQGTNLRFETTPVGSPSSARATRMTISNNGNVGIGVTDPKVALEVYGQTVTGLHGIYNPAAPVGKRFWAQGINSANGNFYIGYRTDEEKVPGQMHRVPFWIEAGAPNSALYINASGNVSFAGAATATAFYQSSDRKLKHNITTISNPFALLEGIGGKRFLWKSGNKPAYGVIAQDVEKIMPEAVRTTDNGTKTVDYSQLIAPLIEAVKQLENRVRYLESVNSDAACNDSHEEKNGVISARGSR